MPDKYVAIGPDLYMRLYYEDGHRDSWLHNYGSDESAQEAAISWNKRNEVYTAALNVLQATEGKQEGGGHE